ncbi:MAG TPA: hypothetical protein VKY22_10535 [Bradyrhizobium sp.]|nr:hypothetical protein [Bradyrhizobium sp.]
MRDDIAQAIFLSLYDGSLQRDQVVKRLGEFVAAYNREANRHGTGKFGLISIDAPAFVEGATPFAAVSIGHGSALLLDEARQLIRQEPGALAP